MMPWWWIIVAFVAGIAVVAATPWFFYWITRNQERPWLHRPSHDQGKGGPRGEL